MLRIFSVFAAFGVALTVALPAAAQVDARMFFRFTSVRLGSGR
jgi:hypothetical protein